MGCQISFAGTLIRLGLIHPDAKSAIESAQGGVTARELHRRHLQGLPYTVDVRQHFGQLDVHLDQSLLHALDPTSLFGQQDFTQAENCPNLANIACWALGRTQKAIDHQLLQPLAVLNVALATGHVLHLTRIDQPNLQTLLFKHLVHRIQYTSVNSSATISTPHASSQSASAFRSSVIVPNSRTDSSAA